MRRQIFGGGNAILPLRQSTQSVQQFQQKPQQKAKKQAAATFCEAFALVFTAQESLRTGDRDDDVKQAIANKIIALAKTGERNPDLRCERALEDIRQPLEAAR